MFVLDQNNPARLTWLTSLSTCSHEDWSDLDYQDDWITEVWVKTTILTSR